MVGMVYFPNGYTLREIEDVWVSLSDTKVTQGREGKLDRQIVWGLAKA